MATKLELHHPWLVAAWPGMGHVALNAGVYLLSRLDMTLFAEYEANELFDVEHVEVQDGLVRSGRQPRNRFFAWKDPRRQHDLVLFLGEAQPPLGKYRFCRQLIADARELGVERVFTFAAMVTRMSLEQPSRVFGAATDGEGLQELQRLEVEILKEGQITGLNGVLLGAAAESDLRGTCLLGEMPEMFAEVPFPRASRSILEVFATMAGIELDLSALSEQAELVEEQLRELVDRVQEAYGEAPFEEDLDQPEPAEEERLGAADRQRIERLFERAAQDRSRAFELKQELDRLGVFAEYENRFLDLFKRPEQGS